MSITGFFAALGAPLRNSRWSWGGVDHENKRVFLRAWEDQVETSKKSGKKVIRLAHHGHYAENPKNLGYAERVRQLDLLREGYRGFVVSCRVKDKRARPRSIAEFDSSSVLQIGDLELIDGDEWGQVECARDASDFATI